MVNQQRGSQGHQSGRSNPVGQWSKFYDRANTENTVVSKTLIQPEKQSLKHPSDCKGLIEKGFIIYTENTIVWWQLRKSALKKPFDIKFEGP